MEVRTSRRLSNVSASPMSDVDSSDCDTDSSWGPEDGSPAPAHDVAWCKEDQLWRKLAVNKFVYFRWSTAFNTKNRFKGVVTDHVSRIGPRGNRID
jgi:hypothetical protein